MPAFFNGAVLLNASNQVYYLKFPDTNIFGYYTTAYFPWVYHYDLGWEYFFDAQDGNGDAYLYDQSTGHFFYTGPALWPYLYDFTLTNWLYYDPDSSNPGHYTTNPRWFYNLGTDQWITQ